MTTGGADGEAVTCEVVVPAPPDEVFRWFVDPELLVRWIGVRAALEPRPGGGFRFEIAAGEWCTGSYVEVVPGRRVVFTWGWDSGAIPVPPGSSTVTEVAVRVEGDTGRFYALAGPFLARAVHRSVGRDLGTLKRVLEARTRPLTPP